MSIKVLFIFMSIVSFIITGCATSPELRPRAEFKSPPETARSFPGFVAVIAKKNDTLSSLATEYLSDPALDWLIADFNGIANIVPGQPIIIPLSAYELGGLVKDGYQTIPVLCYHKFAETASTDKMTVTQSAFDEQMKFLKDNGYRVITLDTLFDFLEFKAQIPRKSLVITIDDGWRSTYDIAFPILRKYGFPATLFIYTDLITGSPKTLSWELIKEMSEGGLDIQNHTKTHRNLSAINQKESFKDYFEAIDAELTESERQIKKRLGKDVKYIAYPFGNTSRLVISLLKKHGYRAAFTVKRGGNPFFFDNYVLNRSMIYGDFDMNQFEENLSSFEQDSLE